MIYNFSAESTESPAFATYDARNQIRRENKTKIGAKAANS